MYETQEKNIFDSLHFVIWTDNSIATVSEILGSYGGEAVDRGLWRHVIL
jgi:hypothetical protein